MLKLSVDQVEEFDPKAAGWTTDALVRLPEFPEVDGRPMVFQRDFYTRGDDRMVIEWDRGWTLRAIARNGHWFEGDMPFERFQELIREVVLNGQTGAEWLAEQFEFELCSDCHGDVKDHEVGPDPFGNWHAWCTFKAPEGTKIKVELQRSDSHWWSYGITLRDAAEELVPLASTSVTFEAPGLDNRAVEGEYSSVSDIKCRGIWEETETLLRDYRERKHNES